MATEKQILGDWGERLVAKHSLCPGCKRSKTLKTLPPNFKCADLICDFCGYLAQVKTIRQQKVGLPESPTQPIRGAAWGPQKERMDAGIYFSLFVVIVDPLGDAAIYFLPRDLQTVGMFVPRKPLGPTAKRAGWQGCMINLSQALAAPVRVSDDALPRFKL